MTTPSYSVFVTKPVVPVLIEAIQYDGTNDAEVHAFVARFGGELIEWIDPARWVTFDGNAEGFPVPVGAWVARKLDGGFGEFDLFEDDDFPNRYVPVFSGGAG